MQVQRGTRLPAFRLLGFLVLRLSRTIRFSVNHPNTELPAGASVNGYAAVPHMVGLGRHYELTVVCGGEVDPITGYFLGIQEIDKAVRQHLIPRLAKACHEAPLADPADVLAREVPHLDRAMRGIVRRARWNLSPYYCVEIDMSEPRQAMMRQRFEFAAAHRLHAPSLSDEQNRALFGKCNSPSGHGHNYVVEPAVAVPLPRDGHGAFTLADLERAVDVSILKPFDHKHLNVDTAEFATGTGVNPSVENIARVCFERLGAELARTGARAALRAVTVWENEKTSCTYPA